MRIPPPKGFANAKLRIHQIQVGEQFGRVYLARHSDPLGFGKTPSRFSDPSRRVDRNRFGVLYLGQTVKVCFLEAVLRDRHDGEFGDLPIGEDELTSRHYAVIKTNSPIRMVDLRSGSAVAMGVPTDVAKAASHSLARKWSAAFHDHPDQPDGIIYPSRLNGHTNLAVYDRAVGMLTAVATMSLLEAPGLPEVLNDLRVSLA